MTRSKRVFFVVSCAMTLAASSALGDPSRLNNPNAPPQPPPPNPPPTTYQPPPPVGSTGSMNAPPPVTGPAPAPVMMSQPPPSYAPPPPVTSQVRVAQARQGLFTALQVGFAMPVVGTYTDVASAGGVGLVSAGWELPGGLSARGEVGYRYLSPTGDNTALGALVLGLGARFTILRESAFHPFVEAFGDLVIASEYTPAGTTQRYGSGLSFGGAAGFEFDLSEQLSLEASARFDYLLSATSNTSSTASEAGGFLNVLVGGTYYY